MVILLKIDDSRIVGFILLKEKDRETLYCEDIIISKDFRGRGYGKFLLGLCIPLQSY